MLYLCQQRLQRVSTSNRRWTTKLKALFFVRPLYFWNISWKKLLWKRIIVQLLFDMLSIQKSRVNTQSRLWAFIDRLAIYRKHVFRLSERFIELTVNNCYNMPAVCPPRTPTKICDTHPPTSNIFPPNTLQIFKLQCECARKTLNSQWLWIPNNSMQNRRRGNFRTWIPRKNVNSQCVSLSRPRKDPVIFNFRLLRFHLYAMPRAIRIVDKINNRLYQMFNYE